jgi:hypothetical protein
MAKMKTIKTRSIVIDRLIEPLSACLTEETARRLVSLKSDSELQARVDELSKKCSAGTLTSEEREEYARYVSFGTFVAMLKSKARQLLANS